MAGYSGGGGGAAGAVVTLPEARQDLFFGRMARVSATEIQLQRYAGKDVEVNGELVEIPAGGISMLNSDNTIDATGGDSGGSLASSTLYYIYVSNSSATFAPSDLRASTTAPSLFNGVRYLGTSGNAANWRFVGWVETDSSSEFVDTAGSGSTAGARLVINYYNRLPLPIQAVPNFPSSYTTASTSYVQANGGVGGTIRFISNGEDGVWFSSHQVGSSSAPPAGGAVGVGVDSTTVPDADSVQYEEVTGTSYSSGAASTRFLAEGVHTLDLLIRRLAGGTATFLSQSGVVGTKGTYLQAMVMG